MSKLYELPGHLIRRLHQISVSAFAAEVAEAGSDLTPVQYAALTVLRDHPGIDQITLAGLIAYDRVTISGVLSRLEKRGLLERAVSGTDRRARSLRMTQTGFVLLDQLEAAVQRAQVRMLDGLTPGEKAIFLELLHKATAAGNEISRAPLRPQDAEEQTG
jgi:DNA-binding MarR family transcriptional regulator